MSSQIPELRLTSGDLQLSQGGVRIKNNSGAAEVRNSADSDYEYLRCKAPAASNDATTLGYLQANYLTSTQISDGYPSGSGITTLYRMLFAGGANAINESSTIVTDASGNLSVTGNISCTGTVDGIDIATNVVLGKAGLTTQYRLPFVNSSGTLAESSSITTNADGDLQIGGTTVGTEKLYVGGKATITGNEMRVQATGAFYSLYTAAGVRTGYFGGSDTAMYFNLDYAGPMIFATAASESFRVNSSGQVLINATTPVGSEKLYVNGDIATSGTVDGIDIATNVVLGKSGLTTQYRLPFVNSSGTLAESSSITTNADGDLQIGGTTVGTEKLYVNGSQYNSDFYDCATGKGLKVAGTQVVTNQQPALTSTLTTVTHDAPVTPDFIYTGSVINTSAYGLSSADEFNTMLSVIANLQTRVNELESKLQTHGLIA